jgi:hypothetical protein
MTGGKVIQLPMSCRLMLAVLFHQITNGKLNVDFLMMVMKIVKPPGIKKFDEETEAKYRKKVGDCNNRSKFLIHVYSSGI